MTCVSLITCAYNGSMETSQMTEQERINHINTVAANIQSQFTLAPHKFHDGKWCAAMVNAEGNLFDDVFSAYINEAGKFGFFKTKKAAAQHQLSSGEHHQFTQACKSVVWAIHDAAKEI